VAALGWMEVGYRLAQMRAQRRDWVLDNSE
jgi:hypothetical protein